MESLKPLLEPVAESGLAMLIGLLIGAFFMILFGYNPVVAYTAMFTGAFGNLTGIFETLAFATPLMLTAITFAIGVKGGLFNVGAEGQVYLGALGAVMAGALITLPPGLHAILATLFAMVMGALWALTPAILKIWRGVHEVVSTIMFNWMAFYFTIYLIVYYLAEPGRAERSLPVLPSSRYPVLWHGSSFTAVFFVAVIFCIAVYFFLWNTKLGYEIRLMGSNPDAAKYAGVSPWRTTVVNFLIGGLASGMAGASQILGRPPAWSLYATLGNVAGYGFDGIGVALIGRNHPLGIILAAIFFGGLENGGRYMEYQAGVDSEMVRAINGIIVLALSIPEILKLIRKFMKKRGV
ncbi:MAG: ribose ABC transporter permease [Thermofilum sp. ex4484_82]|nr:MAG: ribose ABC transporter permease [Thermofilum sp. ex4484_82]OYT38121.1 MAG: ribose ABC transporter permease [Archaeoglobales archaeon ex4484_92]